MSALTSGNDFKPQVVPAPSNDQKEDIVYVRMRDDDVVHEYMKATVDREIPVEGTSDDYFEWKDVNGLLIHNFVSNPNP